MGEASINKLLINNYNINQEKKVRITVGAIL